MVELGIKGRHETTVTTANVATSVGSGKVKVFSTPMMISLMEKAALLSIEPFLEKRPKFRRYAHQRKPLLCHSHWHEGLG